MRSVRVYALLLSLVAVFALAACGSDNGGSGGGGNTITMGVSDFAGNTSLSIQAGQAVTFSDPSDTGGTHDLVTGANGQFSAEAGAPTEFGSSSGINFAPGTTKDITFPTAGTYHITCSIHPTMQATITVS